MCVANQIYQKIKLGRSLGKLGIEKQALVPFPMLSDPDRYREKHLPKSQGWKKLLFLEFAARDLRFITTSP